jgi:hypothetical protein
MQPYDNTNTGILTLNDKGDNPARPDRKGSINVEGVEYWVSGWIKDGREGTKLAGQKYMSLKIEPKEKSAAAPKPAAPAAAEDDLPF